MYLKLLARNRFVILLITTLVFVVVSYLATGKPLPTTETRDMWFYSGLFMLLFSILFIEPYYSSPKNVITNTTPLLLVMFAVKTDFTNSLQWWLILITLLILCLISILSISLNDKNKSPDAKQNVISERLKNLAVLIGQAKVLYSGIFLYFLGIYYVHNRPLSGYMFFLLIFWAIVLLINPRQLSNSFKVKQKDEDDLAVGEIFGVQAKRIFLVKLFDDRKSIRRFDIVRFKYSMHDESSVCLSGIVFDYYLLNQERWAKILQLNDGNNLSADKLTKNTVYKVDSKTEKAIFKKLNVGSFVGIVIEGSAIGKIKFEYSKWKDDLQEGDLLELNVGKRKLFYQVTAGFTDKELLEARNETGFITGEAIQLGEWDSQAVSFKKFGWVPAINTPLFKANTESITPPAATHPEFSIGVIPGTSLPSVLNLNDAVSHHLALLGVTGAGKSRLARKLITQLKTDTKVICIDFNKEFSTEMTPAPRNIINDTAAGQIAQRIDWINNELEKFPNQQDKQQIVIKQNEIKDALKRVIGQYLDSDDFSPVVFELPDVVNTTGILDYTKYFFRVLFEVAKEHQQAGNPIKTCVVLEEAHTIVPEWNFASATDKTSQSLVNSISQIALQGRKYGVGFMVIAQRTANVSKTVLTQCNTVICFQAFDETSINFLSNYVGKDSLAALPNLKPFHAIVAGKAVKSSVPMIIDLTDPKGSTVLA